MASMNEKDYYAILEVSETATTEEIRKAFQVKARKLHPDVNKAPDAEARFKEVSEAYAVLSDEGKRRRYDAMRAVTVLPDRLQAQTHTVKIPLVGDFLLAAWISPRGARKVHGAHGRTSRKPVPILNMI